MNNMYLLVVIGIASYPILTPGVVQVLSNTAMPTVTAEHNLFKLANDTNNDIMHSQIIPISKESQLPLLDPDVDKSEQFLPTESTYCNANLVGMKTFKGYTIMAGTNNNDKLNGTSGKDLILGLDGDDSIVGKGLEDIICGGNGIDYIWGNYYTKDEKTPAEKDLIFGQDGDLIFGQDGDDYIYAGREDDSIYGGAGSDHLFGELGNDNIVGGYGEDFMYGGLGNDNIVGSYEGDQLFGREGDDVLQGSNGNDLLSGGQGNDKLYGGNGNDKLEGDMGYDALDGGPQYDLCLEYEGITSFSNCEKEYSKL